MKKNGLIRSMKNLGCLVKGSLFHIKLSPHNLGIYSSLSNNRLGPFSLLNQWWLGGLGPGGFGFLGSPYELMKCLWRGWLLGESQTTGPQTTNLPLVCTLLNPLLLNKAPTSGEKNSTHRLFGPKTPRETSLSVQRWHSQRLRWRINTPGTHPVVGYLRMSRGGRVLLGSMVSKLVVKRYL